MNLFAWTVLVLFATAQAQQTPAMVGRDVYTPGLILCNQPDHHNPYVTQCDPYRSSGCVPDNFRCLLADVLSAGNTSQSLIRFSVTQWAGIQPGDNEGALRVNLRYADGRYFQFSGNLQLWRLEPTSTNTFRFKERMNEVDYAMTIDQQTYLYFGLNEGTYVFVYWDDGGTQYATGSPEISQRITLNPVLSRKQVVQMQSLPPDAYNTNYTRANRNFISYGVFGASGFADAMLNACNDERYNRCPVWFWTSDQGNRINAKFTLEPVPPVAAAAGFTDSMLKFKFFPIMCCSRRTRITFAMRYGGPFPLFPTSYQDIWTQRQRYGFISEVVSKTIVLSRTYLDDQFTNPSSNMAASWKQYQILVSANYNTTTAQPNPNYPACPWQSARLNTLMAVDANTEEYHVTTLRRMYCECYVNRQCTITYPNTDFEVSQGVRVGTGSLSNNFDMFSDYVNILDLGQFATTTIYGNIFGRPYSLGFDFTPHGNYDTADYSCNPQQTEYSRAGSIDANYPPNPWTGGGQRGSWWSTSNGGAVFADIVVTKDEVKDFYNFDDPNNPCFSQDATAPSPTPQQQAEMALCQPNSGQNSYWQRDGIVPGETGTYLPQYGSFTQSQCNCLSRAGYHLDYIFPPTQDPAFTSSFWEFVYQGSSICNAYDTFAISTMMCCNKIAQYSSSANNILVFGIEGYITNFPGGVTQYLNTDWRGNQEADMFQTNKDDLCLGSPNDPPPNPGLTYFSGDSIDNNVIPNQLRWRTLTWPNNVGGTDNPGPYWDAWCYGDHGNECLLYMPLLPTPRRTLFSSQVQFMRDNTGMFMFNFQTVTQANPFYVNLVDRDGETVFGTYGLDTFPVVFDTNATAYSNTPSGPSPYQLFQVRNTLPTFSRFKVIPEILFYSFSNADFSTPQPTIFVTFQVKCPYLNLDDTPGLTVGYCAQFWFILNQNYQNVLVEVMSITPHTGVSEQAPWLVAPPYTNLPVPYQGLTNTQILPDVVSSAVLTLKINYNDGDVLSWVFFPKTEPQQAVGTDYCGGSLYYNYSGFQTAVYTVRVPLYYRAYQPLIAAVRTVQPACEYNSFQMLINAQRGEPYVTEVSIAQNLPQYQITGNPLPYSQGMNYWYDWNINTTTSEGMSVYALPYDSNAVGNVYDRYNHVTGLIPPVPAGNATYPNPLVRSTSCQNNNATCYSPDDSGTNLNYSGIDQNPYWDGTSNNVLLVPRLIFAPPYTFATTVGAVYCNETTQYVDIFIQEQMDKAVFEMQLECPVNVTAWWTYTVRYGISIVGLLEDFPCYERFVTYVIVLTSFQAEPAPIQRVAGCNRPDNCCYFLPINVFGNTGFTEDIVNLATQCNATTNLECAYEIVVRPPPANATATSYGGLCPGQTYSFTVQSPEALVMTRKEATLGTNFEVPWRGPAVYNITLPRIGFDVLNVDVFNGNCKVQGNFVEFTTTFTNFACANAISAANPNPDCAYNLLLAFVATNAPGWPGTVATLANPWLLAPTNPLGPTSVSYNLAFTISLPQLFGTASPLDSIPNGVYDIYLWISPAGMPYQSYASVVAQMPTNGIQTEIQAVFESNNGLKIIRTAFTRPQCPATINQTRDEPISQWAMNLAFNVRDQNWNGPYNLTFTAPDGTVLSFYQVVGNSPLGCAIPCAGDLSNITDSCPACDIYMRDQGIDYTFYIGTGVLSPNQQGLYMISAYASLTSCHAAYLEFTVPMNTLQAQISCSQPTCAGADNGVVRGYASGGTMRPILQSDLVQNSDLTLAVLRYYISFTVTTNTSVLVYPNQTLIPNAGAGRYVFNLTDFNGCYAEATCVATEQYEPIELYIVGVGEPNCSTDYGDITVAVVNRTFLPQELPLTLYALGPDQHPVNSSMGTVLTDTNVHPGVSYLYTVCTQLMCCAPYVNLTVDAGITLEVVITAQQLPCVGGPATGILEALVSPAGVVTTFMWYYNNQLQTENTATFNNAQTGSYRVVVHTITGCVAEATYVLPTSASFTVIVNRTAPDISPAIIDGVMYGGNGPPYRVTVSPQDIADIVDIVVFNAVPGDNEYYSSFAIYEVPIAATVLIDVFDSKSCVVRVQSQGGNPPEPPTPGPTPPPPPKKQPHKSYDMQVAVILSVVFTLAVTCGCVFATSQYDVLKAEAVLENRRRAAAGRKEKRR
jgi:hypothetical protein